MPTRTLTNFGENDETIELLLDEDTAIQAVHVEGKTDRRNDEPPDEDNPGLLTTIAGLFP